MTALTDPFDHAYYVQRVVEAACQPGGPLHRTVDQLTAEASGLAMDATGIAYAPDRGANYPWNPEELEAVITTVVAEHFFRATRAYLAPPTIPGATA